jgi:hypothetical protein
MNGIDPIAQTDKEAKSAMKDILIFGQSTRGYSFVENISASINAI